MIQIDVDLRAKLEPVRNQGRRPTCLAFATSSVHRAAHGHSCELCAEWLYFNANKQDGLRVDQGSTVEASRSVIAVKGQPDETYWPYQGSEPNPSLWAPPTGAPPVL